MCMNNKEATGPRQLATGPCHTATIHQLVSRQNRFDGNWVWVPICSTNTQLYGEAWAEDPAITCKKCLNKKSK